MKKINIVLNTLIILLFGTHQLFAKDVRISILKEDTKKPIEGVNFCWQLLEDNKKAGYGISDEKGKLTIELPTDKKVIIAASCVGYKTLVDTIFLQKNNLLYLEQDVFNLNQVIVLGNSKPMPIDSSLYTVRVIDKKKILNSGANNLGDLFLTEPNVQISTDLILGTKVEMLGLSGSNVKIMIDGVPVIGRLSGQIDLNQITMDNVDHVEVIEGPMSVVYGNNALAGTINIITHKNKYFNTEVNVNAGYEDVKKFDAGASISQKIGKNIFTVSGNFSDFQGVDFDKTTRSMEWKPQRHYAANVDYLLRLKNWTLDTKASLYNNEIKIKGDIQNYAVHDSYYFTDRYTGVATLKGKWNTNNHLNVLASHSYYNRSSQEEYKDLTTLESEKEDKISSQKEHNSLLRSVWHHKFETASPLSLESGIDFNLSSMRGERIKDGKQSLNDYAVFANLRYSPWKDFELQPGVRFAYNTGYDAPLVYSLNAKWNITDDLSWRISAAKGFRAPTVKELYLIFVNFNHHIYGNSNLKAEKSNNYSTSLDYKLSWGENSNLKTNLQLYYNDVENLISLVEQEEVTFFKYENIDEYKTRGGSLGFTYFYKNWLRMNANSILTSRYSSLGKEFKTTYDWIVGLQIKEPKTKITFNTDLKLYGRQNYFYSAPNQEIKVGERASYEMLNASLSRSFWENRITVAVGAKNLTNIKNVELTGQQSGGGHNTSSSSDISYGRTFFVKANFRITK